MAKRSAGVLLYRRRAQGIEALLVHPGGPFWMKKDAGAWSIPKGEIGEDEDPQEAARREFEEETGFHAQGGMAALGAFAQPSGKTILAFALEGDLDASRIASNLCRIEWPPKSGRLIDIPEIDRAGWFGLAEAETKIVTGQRPILAALAALVEG